MTNINTYKIPFQTYGDEAEYIAPDKVSKESIKRIKARNQKIGSIFTGRFTKLAA